MTGEQECNESRGEWQWSSDSFLRFDRSAYPVVLQVMLGLSAMSQATLLALLSAASRTVMKFAQRASGGLGHTCGT